MPHSKVEGSGVTVADGPYREHHIADSRGGGAESVAASRSVHGGRRTTSLISVF